MTPPMPLRSTKSSPKAGKTRRFRKLAPAMIPPRLHAAQSGIDGEALRKQLTGIAISTPQNAKNRPLVLTVLKETLQTAKRQAQDQFEHGRLGGLETARLISAIHDDIITALFDYTTTHIVRASNPTKAERLALCAVGGYGRAEMGPASDVDLLFLVADKKGSAFTENVTEYILYMLWDLGLKVGHATRTIEQSIALAKDDQTILTALLDLRFLKGELALAQTLFTQFRKDVTKGKGRRYISTKLQERDARHEREGNSRYVIEPNIKEGKGGLRDLHVLYWIARFLDSDGKITDPQRASDYVDMGLFDQTAATRFMRAADYLWRARIHLHFTAGRATETLSFDHQTVLARKMGYASGPIEEAVEKFMREYFTNAREVGALTRIACAKLEADNAIVLPKGIDRFLPSSRRHMKEDGFVIDHGRLMFEDSMQIRPEPVLIMRLFEISGRYNLDIHPDAFFAIDFRRNLIDTDFRRNPEIAAVFKKVLLGSKAPYAILKLMNEAGVLGRYILEFGGIVARTQFNMHHAYTVDEHSLRLVRYFHDLWIGDLDSENPVATQIVKGFTPTQLLTLYLTCLLHDTGKGVGDQCVEGARLARRACRRLGVDQAIIENVAWLVRSHLDMSETAQRRDTSDPQTIAEFSRRVGALERLDMLYALTIVDIRAVGPGIWNDWKGVLLRGLHASAADYLIGNTHLAPAAKADAIKVQIKDRLPGDMATRIAPIIQDLKASYWTSFNMADLVRHARFFDTTLDASPLETSFVQTRRDKPRDITELWVLTEDRPGLFADLTLAISATGASITGARLHTGDNKRVMNIYYLQNPDGFAFGRQSDRALEGLRQNALRAAKGDTDTFRIANTLASKRAGAIPVRPNVAFIDGASSDATIIEIEGRDRPGLLYALAACLHDAKLDILSAHIENVGEKAIDAFYVRCQNGEDLPDDRRKKIKSKLMSTLKNADPQTAP